MVDIKREPLQAHIAHVATLQQAGIDPPAAWAAVRQRLENLVKLATPCRDRLIEVILNGDDTADLGGLRSGALVESGSNAAQFADLNRTVAASVHRRLVDIYRPHAADSYATIAARFDDAAAAFTSSATVVDPEAEAELIVGASRQARDAWTEAPMLAATLASMVDTLKAAAELAGTPIPNRQAVLALTVDDNSRHRRRLWEAFDMKGRTLRYGPIVKAGAIIRAAKLDQFTPYPLPEPMQLEQRPLGAGRYEEVIVDPHDEPAPAVAGP